MTFTGQLGTPQSQPRNIVPGYISSGGVVLELAADLVVEFASVADPVVVIQLHADLVVDLASIAKPVQIQRLRADMMAVVALSDGYTGPGSGVVVGDQTLTLDSLVEGDSFPCIIPAAGGSGMTGLARVVNLTYDDKGRPSFDIEFHSFTDGATVLGLTSSGRLQYTLRQRGDLVRQVVKQGQDVAALDRSNRT